MFDYISGVLVQAGPDTIVLEVMGLGIKAYIPPGSAANFGRVGEKVIAYTQVQVLENEFKLYAFPTQAEQELFTLLLTVSGLGARTALNVLATLSVSDFYQSVLAGDEKNLMRVPGVGKKMAQRIIFELAEKVKRVMPGAAVTDDYRTEQTADRLTDEMLSALSALGYNQREVMPRLNQMKKEGLLTGVVSEDLKTFLKGLDSGKGERI